MKNIILIVTLLVAGCRYSVGIPIRTNVERYHAIGRYFPYNTHALSGRITCKRAQVVFAFEPHHGTFLGMIRAPNQHYAQAVACRVGGSQVSIVDGDSQTYYRGTYCLATVNAYAAYAWCGDNFVTTTNLYYAVWR